MTARAFGEPCGARGARSAPRDSRASSVASAAPKVPPATDSKKPRRSVHIDKSRGVHQRVAIARQRLEGCVVLAGPEGREAVQRVESDAALVVSGESAERDQVRPLDLPGPVAAGLAQHAAGEIFGKLLDHAVVEQV